MEENLQWDHLTNKGSNYSEHSEKKLKEVYCYAKHLHH
jgi:hypothetical protein